MYFCEGHSQSTCSVLTVDDKIVADTLPEDSNPKAWILAIFETVGMVKLMAEGLVDLDSVMFGSTLTFLPVGLNGILDGYVAEDDP